MLVPEDLLPEPRRLRLRPYLLGGLALLVVLGWSRACVLERRADQTSAAVQAATRQAETATRAARRVETAALSQRPAVARARARVTQATETRVASGIRLEDLPAPVQAEIAALQALTQAQEVQIVLEVQRAEAWQAAEEAQEARAEALAADGTAQAKSAWWKGLRWGTLGGGLLVVVLVVVLL